VGGDLRNEPVPVEGIVNKAYWPTLGAELNSPLAISCGCFRRLVVVTFQLPPVASGSSVDHRKRSLPVRSQCEPVQASELSTTANNRKRGISGNRYWYE